MHIRFLAWCLVFSPEKNVNFFFLYLICFMLMLVITVVNVIIQEANKLGNS